MTKAYRAADRHPRFQIMFARAAGLGCVSHGHVLILAVRPFPACGTLDTA